MAEAEAVFHDLVATGFCFFVFGSAGVLLVVVYAERDGVVRLISARRATRREARTYAE